MIYILNHLLRKGRIQKRHLVEFTFPEKGAVAIVWQDAATGEIIHEPTAPSGVLAPADDEDPLA